MDPTKDPNQEFNTKLTGEAKLRILLAQRRAKASSLNDESGTENSSSVHALLPTSHSRSTLLPSKREITLRFWDIGQVWNGSEWEDLDFYASPDITTSAGPHLTTVDSLDSSHWDAYLAKIFEVPLSEWPSTYRQVSYEDAFRYGFDVYTGDPSLVVPTIANVPAHLDFSKYYPVATDWQRPPVDYYVQTRKALQLMDDYSAGASSILVRHRLSLPSNVVQAGSRLCLSRTNIVTVTATTTIPTGTGSVSLPISPLLEDVNHVQVGYIDDLILPNRNAWTDQGLRIKPSDYFNLVSFNSFMNIGLWFTPHITMVNDPGGPAVPFKLNKATDFFLVPALVANHNIGAWNPGDDPLEWLNNSYLNFDFRPWSRSQFLNNPYFERYPTRPFPYTEYETHTPMDCPVFAKGQEHFTYESNVDETVPLPDEWETLLEHLKTVNGARQFKEEGPGLTTTDDFAVSPQAQLWIAEFSARNTFDIDPNSYAYVTPGSLMAVAKQGNKYFYFWYNGTQKINAQNMFPEGVFDLIPEMQRLQFEYNYAIL